MPLLSFEDVRREFLLEELEPIACNNPIVHACLVAIKAKHCTLEKGLVIAVKALAKQNEAMLQHRTRSLSTIFSPDSTGPSCD